MKQFIRRHAMSLNGVVSGFDRLVSRRTLRTAYSDANRSVIPSETDRQFQRKPIIDSDSIRSRIPTESDHVGRSEVDAG